MSPTERQQQRIQQARVQLLEQERGRSPMGDWLWRAYVTLGAIAKRGWTAEDGSDPIQLPEPQQALLSNIAIRALSQSIQHVDSTIVGQWSVEQIEALGEGQIQALLPKQLKALIANPVLSGTMLRRIVSAYGREGHANKLGDLLFFLHADPLRSEKIHILIDTILSLSNAPMRRLLSAFAKMASNKQFEVLLKELPQEKLLELFHQDQLDSSSAEWRKLSLRIERERFENNMLHRKLQLQATQLEQTMELSSLDPIISLLKRHRDVNHGDADLHDLEQILNNARNVVSRVAGSLKLDVSVELPSLHVEETPLSESLLSDLEGIRNQMKQAIHQVDHQLRYTAAKQLSPQHFIDEWKVDYLPSHYQKVLKGFTPAFDRQERFAQATQLDQLLEDARADRKFLRDSYQWFSDRIRLEAGIGRFSIAFFRRLIEYHLFRELQAPLFTENIEEILSIPGLLEIFAIIELKVHLERIVREISHCRSKC